MICRHVLEQPTAAGLSSQAMPAEASMSGVQAIIVANKWFENGKKTSSPTHAIPDFNHVQAKSIASTSS